MSLEKILSISGKPGLYQIKAKTRSGFVAESLQDGKKLPVNLRHNVSMLSEIAIYTYSDEVPLPEVFEKIIEKEDGGKAISHRKPKKELRAYFEDILPEYDEDRVYDNNIKKIVQWYNILIENGFTRFSNEEENKNESPEDKKEASEDN